MSAYHTNDRDRQHDQDYDYDYEYDTLPWPASGQKRLAGAHRASANPRLHALQKPYSRPASYSGPTASGSSSNLASPGKYDLVLHNGGSNGHMMAKSGSAAGAGSISPSKPAPTTRPTLPTSHSARSLPRSGSDSSLFGSLKGLITKPLSWLATPRANSKRDQTSWTAGGEVEDPEVESPSVKRIRRQSPPRRRGVYDPDPESYHAPRSTSNGDARLEIEGRTVSGFMLPPLPPNISLGAGGSGSGSGSRLEREKTGDRIGQITNFSRPLPSSKSMPYLDPPMSALSPARGKRSGLGVGAMTRSRKLELSDLAGDDEEVSGMEHSGSVRGKGKDTEDDGPEAWSPWKNRDATQARVGSPRTTPLKRATRGSTVVSMAEGRDYTLPSLSPFKAPPSPRQPTPNFGLAPSATTVNLRRDSFTSDVSMGKQSSLNQGLKASSSMLFRPSGLNGDAVREDERMSVDGDRGRESSAMDWFMRDTLSAKAPGSPASRAASKRLSSLAPSTSMPAIRKGQMVWDAEKGFVRESELRAAETPKPVHQNDAERILFALESMRKTPLSDARKTPSSGSLPPELIGSSSRQLRQAINVPLATAQTGDNARSRKDKERLGDERVSVMISPYGRRRVVDREVRERSSQPTPSEENYRASPSRSLSEAPTERSRRSGRSNQDHEMASSERTPEPEPAPQPTPRRSSRLKRTEPPAEEATPKTRTRGKGKSPAPLKDAAIETTQPKESGRRKRKPTVERTSPESTPPVPSVPTITETAPSPSDKSSKSTYAPRSDNELPRGSSSLRARTEITKRTHASSANSSRGVSPNSGRYSAREEDLPDMEELEQTKISLPSSFTGISFGLSAPTPKQDTPAVAPASDSGSSLLGRLGPATSSNASSLSVPSNSGRSVGGPLSRLSSTRPRASSPLAAGSIVAEPDSPDDAKRTKAASRTETPTVSALKPDENGFFSLSAGLKPSPTASLSAPSTSAPTSSFFAPPSSSTTKPVDAEPAKKQFSFGLGKPSTPASASGSTETSSSVPNFFGQKSQPGSGTTTPAIAASPPPFQFGSSLQKVGEAPKESASASSPFSFGKAAETTTEKPAAAPAAPAIGSFNFGASKAAEPTPAPTASTPFSFGASKAAEPAKEHAQKSTFSFGTPSAPPANPSTESAPKATFSFGTSTQTPETPKSTFSFGAPAASTPTADGAGTAKAAEPAKTSFSFGTPAPSTPAVTEPPKTSGFSFGGASGSTTPAASPAPATKASFTFGAPAATAPSTVPAASTPAASTSSFGGFGFGKPAETKAAEPAKDAQPANNPFGSASANGGGFGFGNSSTTPAKDATQTNGTSAGFGSTAPTASFGFGSSTAQSNGNGPSTPSFGGAATSSTPSSSFTFGQAPPSNSFGAAPAAASPAPSFTFGANTSTAPASGSAFGSSAPSSNPFGGGNPAQTAPPSTGFGFTFGGNSNTANTASAPAPSFGFGSAQPTPAPAPTTPTTTPSSFNFGAPASSGSGGFTFGAPASTTPSGPPPSFAFGAQGQAQGQGQGQSQQAPRFGSPAASPGPDGGFSLGMGPDGVPGSPGGGRKIKPLRRGAVKR